MLFGKKLIIVWLCLSVLPAGITKAAKSIFIISKHIDPSEAQAYSINGDQVTFQAMVDISTLNPGYGAVGNAVWPEKDLMFVTYENSPMIVWASTKTLQKVGELDTGVSDLSGIAIDEEKEKIYVVRRNYDDLYVYSYDQGNNTLTLDQHCELVLPYPGEFVTAWG